MKTSPLALVAVFAAVPLFASTLDDKIKAFDDALTTSAPEGSARSTLLAGPIIPTLDPSSYPGGESGLEARIQQMIATSNSPAVQKAGDDLLNELKAEQKARTAAVESRVTAVLSRIPAVIEQAQKPADLDAILSDIQDAMPVSSNFGMDPDTAFEANRLNSAYQFVSLARLPLVLRNRK